MDKFDHILNLLKRLVELNEEIVHLLGSLQTTGCSSTKPGDESIVHATPNIEENQQNFCSEVLSLVGGSDPDPAKWATMLNLQEMLGVSRRTTYRIRDDGQIRWIKIRGLTLLYKPDIFKLIDRYLK